MKRLFFCLAVIGTVAFAAPASAAKFDFSQPLRTFEGNLYKDETGKEIGKPISEFCQEALLATFGDETTIDPTEKFKRFELAKKLYASKGEVDLSDEELILLRRVVGKAYPTPIMGSIWMALGGMPPTTPNKAGPAQVYPKR